MVLGSLFCCSIVAVSFVIHPQLLLIASSFVVVIITKIICAHAWLAAIRSSLIFYIRIPVEDEVRGACIAFFL